MSSFICKISYFVLLALIQTLSLAQGTWERVDVPTNQYLKSVCFVDSLYGWIAGDSGTILHTTDGGTTWIQQDTHADNEIADVFFLNRNQGWASSFNFNTSPYGTILLKTTNGGADWLSQPYPTENLFMTCILFFDSLNGWMGGKPHALVKTTDGGISWVQAAVDTSTLAFFPVLCIQFYNEKYGYASGGMFDIAGVIWRTSNGGERWYAIDPSDAPADEVHGLHIFDTLNAMGSGGDPDFGYGVGMIRTADGGLNWSYDELDIQGYAQDLDFRDASEAWAPLGTKLKLIYSLDTGLTWTPIPTPDSTAIYDMIFPDSLHGFAVGKNGAFLKYHPPVIPSVTPISHEQTGFLLYQNYPNPVHSGTTIKFKIPAPDPGPNGVIAHPFSSVQIKICNFLGKEVATLVSKELFPGNHEVKFDATELPEGCYFYSLQVYSSGSFLTVAGPKQMIVLKSE